MKFETRMGEDAAGWQLAQAVMVEGRRLPKGATVDQGTAKALGPTPVQVFQLEAGDLTEDEAAERLVSLGLFGNGLDRNQARTGRINALARSSGLLRVRAESLGRFNARDEGLTLATLPDWQRVEAGDLVATLKVIPFAVSGSTLAAFPKEREAVLEVLPFKNLSVSLIQTKPPSVKAPVLDKGAKALASRLEALGSRLNGEERVAHETEAVAKALSQARGELIIIFPGAATQDRRDVGPSGLEAAGGSLVQVGMPVDPGNLLFFGHAKDGRPVIGAPGCARSVAFNGFDWVLERVCVGQAPTANDIRGLGLGGLLKEIPSRPLPRLGV